MLLTYWPVVAESFQDSHFFSKYYKFVKAFIILSSAH